MSAGLGTANAPCNLCGGPVGAGEAPACAACGATVRERVTRRLFLSLPLGMLAWRRAAIGAGMAGIHPAWFACAPLAWPAVASADCLEFVAMAAPPMASGAEAAALATAIGCLSPRGVLYVAGTAPSPGTLEQALAWIHQALPDCSVIALETQDPCSALRGQAWLAMRDDRDARAWAQQLQSWDSTLRLRVSGPAATAAAPAPAGALPRLRAELARWEAEGLDCPLWWRDDDLIADGPALRRLAALSERFAVPALLAVIPAQADRALADSTAQMSTLSFCQHGWNHVSHEGEGKPKSEFGAQRATTDAERDIVQGAERLREQFGPRFLPVFVPPWNSITPALAERLPALGLHGLSQYVGIAPLRVPGLVRVDTHVDIVDWGVPGGVRDPDELVERLVSMLRLRLEGKLHEPIGILSHHRAMGEGTWTFLEQLLSVLGDYGCVRWLEPRSLFADPAPRAFFPCAA